MGALHEPTVWCPGFSRTGPPEGGTPNKFCRTVRFKVPMHAKKNERGLFMNRRLVLVVVLVLDSRACLRGRGRAGGRSGSWSRCMRKKAERGLSMNRTYSVYALPAKAAEGRRTPRRWRVGQGHPKLRQVLMCAAPTALWISQ